MLNQDCSTLSLQDPMGQAFFEGNLDEKQIVIHKGSGGLALSLSRQRVFIELLE